VAVIDTGGGNVTGCEMIKFVSFNATIVKLLEPV
jgi:hypothetical protein